MSDFLDRLQKKSDREKTRITISVSILVTAIIFVFWIFSFTGGFSFEDNISDKSVEEKSSPVKVFVDNFKSGIGEIKATFKENLDF